MEAHNSLCLTYAQWREVFFFLLFGFHEARVLQCGAHAARGPSEHEGTPAAALVAWFRTRTVLLLGDPGSIAACEPDLDK